MAKCDMTAKGGTFCEAHQCGFSEPCLKRDCPHCGTERPSAKKQARLLHALSLAQGRVERLEKKAATVLGRLTSARADLLALRRRAAKLDQTLDVTDVESLEKLAKEIENNSAGDSAGEEA